MIRVRLLATMLPVAMLCAPAIAALLATGCATTQTPATENVDTCNVVGVTDGDTLTVRCDGKPHEKVRLSEIDAPEMRQAFGHRSKQSLSEICFGKPATLDRNKRPDRYKRTIARVHCNGVDANAEQVRRGMAWVYDRYVTDHSLYELQREAQEAKRGLWADKEPVRPWEWRGRR
jgi:endonuclease YncB( thermonuclease family)